MKCYVILAGLICYNALFFKNIIHGLKMLLSMINQGSWDKMPPFPCRPLPVATRLGPFPCTDIIPPRTIQAFARCSVSNCVHLACRFGDSKVDVCDDKQALPLTRRFTEAGS